MGRVTYAFPVEKLQGKANKQDSVYFCAMNGRTYIRRIVNAYGGNMTTAQERSILNFKETVERVRAIMSDKTSDAYKDMLESWKKNNEGCVTLYGYIFMKKYGM